MQTANRGYPLLNGGIDNVVNGDLLNAKNAFSSIDTDIKVAMEQVALGASARQPGVLKATTVVTTPVTSVSFNIGSYEIGVGKACRLELSDVVLSAVYRNNLGFAAGGAANHWYVSKQTKIAEPWQAIREQMGSYSPMWNINEMQDQMKYIRRMYCDYLFLTGGTYGLWKGQARAAVTDAWLQHDGYGSVGFGQGGGATFDCTQISFHAWGPTGTFKINSGTFKLYEMDTTWLRDM